MAEPVLSCKGLTFRYRSEDAPVFSNLSLTVSRGEAALLMGPSGCGKSTLAYCLAGLYPEYGGELEGEILLKGKPLSQFGPAARSQAVSILFQNPDNQFCMDRVDHEILFALENINYSGDLRARTRELLTMVGLEQVETAPIYTLSGGTKQKLALATALATGADTLILDEPFANLDPGACGKLSALLEQLNRQGITLLIVDHRPNWWRGFLSRIVLMEQEGDLDQGSIPPQRLDEYREEFSRLGLFLDDQWLAGHSPAPVPQPPGLAAKAEGLILYHGKKPFLRNLSFQLEKGSVTALIGGNGAGKTTLLTALAGAGRWKGNLWVQGKVGLVFQNPRFQFLTLTVENEVLVTLRAAEPQGEPEALKEKAAALLEEFGLLPWKKNSPYELSQGQQRRLALLSMLAGDRPLLLLDEPTYAQDERSTSFILSLLERRVSQGLTVLMATHDLALAKACANQILLLENGSLTPVEPQVLSARWPEGTADRSQKENVKSARKDPTERPAYRDNGNNRERRQIAPLGAVLSHKVKDSRGNGTVDLVLNKGHAVSQVAPGVQERENGAYHHARQGDRDKDSQKRAEPVTAVDARRILQLLRNGAEIVLQNQDGKGNSDRRVRQNRRKICI